MIYVKDLQRKMRDYFILLIEEGKQEVDILECNAELQKIISRIPKINEWIPVEESLPENDDYILLSFENFSLPSVGRYESYDDGSGAFLLETMMKVAFNMTYLSMLGNRFLRHMVTIKHRNGKKR